MKSIFKYSLFIIASIFALGGECAKNIIDPPKEPVIEEMTLSPDSPVNPGDTVTVTVTATGELQAKNSVKIYGPSRARMVRIWQMKLTARMGAINTI